MVDFDPGETLFFYLWRKSVGTLTSHGRTLQAKYFKFVINNCAIVFLFKTMKETILNTNASLVYGVRR